MKAVILAGGLGTRLKPFTNSIPKPLLPIGEQSLLELQISRFADAGFDQVFIATNYKSDYIENFIGNSSRLGVKVTFSKEEKPLGTCGPLSKIRADLTVPFILINGDILTTIDFKKLYQFGIAQDTSLTVTTKKTRTPFNFGSVKTDGNYITNVEEKPDLVLEIVAGIYFMKPSIFSYIPDDTYFGINHLIEKMLANKAKVSRYLMEEYWLDIGQIDDYSKAEDAYNKYFTAGAANESKSL